MLSTSVTWSDVDPVQWANLWRLIHAPARTPTRAIGILDDGIPLALAHGQSGQVPLAAWPDDASSLEEAASTLRHQLEVDQVILIELATLVSLWDEQQRTVDSEADYDDYLFAIGRLTHSALHEQAVCVPSTIPRFPAIPYPQFSALIADAVGPRGSFLITVFDGDSLWWSLAGSIVEGSIVRLTSSQGLLPAGAAPPPGRWDETDNLLVTACGTVLGEVRLVVRLQLPAFEALLRASDVPREIERLATTGDVFIWRAEA